MMPDEYSDRCKGPHQRLDILRTQLEAIARNSHPMVSQDAIQPLVQRMGEICDELEAIDAEFFGEG